MTAAIAKAYARVAAELPLWPEMRVAIEPPPLLDAATFAERFLYLPSGSSERAGKFSFATAPFQREVLSELSNPSNRQVVLQWPPQVGKTTVLMAWVAWIARCHPTQVLWTLPEWDDVGYTFTERWAKVVAATPELEKLCPRGVDEAVSRRRCVLSNEFSLHGASGRSANSMRGKPIQFAVSDEVSAWPVIAKLTEGTNPIDLVDNRLGAFRRRLHLLASTPVLADDPFDQAYSDTDDRRFWLPCPRCGTFQRLEERQLRWRTDVEPRDVREHGEARYLCTSCEHPIADEEKIPAMQRGVWAPAAAEVDPRTGRHDRVPTDTPGFHLSALYSPTARWCDYAAALARARKHPARHAQALENYWRVRGWRPTVTGVEASPSSRRIAYRRGVIPETYLLLTAGVDVQADYLVWVIRAWGWDEQSWLVDHGTAADWPALDAVLFADPPAWEVGPVPDLDDESPVPPRPRKPRLFRVCVDAADGNRADEVYAYARERRTVVVPARGNDGKRMATPFRLGRLTPKTRIKAAVGQQYVTWANPHYFAKLTAGMTAERGARGAWWVPTDVDEDYLAQLAATRLVARKKADGSVVEEWQEGDANHYFDAECMAWVAAELAGIGRYMRRGVAGVHGGGKAEQLRRRKVHGGLRR